MCCLQGHVPVITSHDSEGMVPLPNRRSAVGNGDACFGTLSSQVISEEYTAVESYPVNCVAMYDYQVSAHTDYLCCLEGECIHAFDWYRSQLPCMTLNGHCALAAQHSPRLFEAHCRLWPVAGENGLNYVDFWIKP